MKPLREFYVTGKGMEGKTVHAENAKGAAVLVAAEIRKVVPTEYVYIYVHGRGGEKLQRYRRRYFMAPGSNVVQLSRIIGG